MTFYTGITLEDKCYIWDGEVFLVAQKFQFWDLYMKVQNRASTLSSGESNKLYFAAIFMTQSESIEKAKQNKPEFSVSIVGLFWFLYRV